MANTHSAKSLFDKNIVSAQECITLYQGMKALDTNLQIHWILRAAVVFTLSAIDAYVHDKVKYRVGRFDFKKMSDVPDALGKFKIQIANLPKWDKSKRKGTVVSGWVTDYFSYRPLQKSEDIANALRLIGIDKLWERVEPNLKQRKILIDKIKALGKRRNQIAHEGDRQKSRKSGKKLNDINDTQVNAWITFAKSLVDKIEAAT
jgi:hypothetical protein